ncbi:cytochrome P450 [Xylariales sp. AK1849]|nr:cytochrome P450 [Xylariales sp. AK1849]
MAISIVDNLTTFSIPQLLGLTIGVYIVVSYASAWYRLRTIKGPFLASFSYLWMFRVALTGEQAVRYRAITQKYGGLARIGPNDLITNDPEIVRRMNGARSPYKRSSWYQGLRTNPYHDSLFSMTNTDAHDKLKAQMSYGYGGKENPTIEDGIDEQLINMVGLIRRKYVTTDKSFKPLDMATIANYFTLDAITRIAYGKEFGYLETDTDVYSYIQTVETNVPLLVLFAEIPLLRRLFYSPFALRFIGPKPTDKEGVGKMLGVAHEVVSRRFGSDAEEKLDMLGSFVRHGVSREQCEGEIMFQIIAGADTTATALRGTMLHVMSAPYVYQKLQQEIDIAIAEGLISEPAKAEEGRKLEYLQAVIYEGLRTNLPFSGLLMKEVPPGGDTIQGHFVPGGTRIATSLLAILRSNEIFGPDAELFRPERWLNIDIGKKREMVQIVELVFGHGRWGCAGKPVAFMELNKVYIELLRYFDYQLVHPNHPMHTRNHNMFFQKDMWVRVTERRHDDASLEKD